MDKSAVPSLLRFQALVGLALLAVMIGPFVAADLLVRSDAVAIGYLLRILKAAREQVAFL